jgi:hypothetical protein
LDSPPKGISLFCEELGTIQPKPLVHGASLILTSAPLADGHLFSVARKSQVGMESSTALQPNATD